MRYCLWLFCLFSAFSYTYRNSNQYVAVTSVYDSALVREVYKQLNLVIKRIDYDFGIEKGKKKIIINFKKDIAKQYFSFPSRYVTSEKFFRQKNIFEVFYILNKLGLKRVFYEWDLPRKKQIPNWLIASYVNKSYLKWKLSTQYLIIPPFICTQIKRGRVLNVKRLLGGDFLLDEPILYHTIGVYSALFHKMLLSLAGKEKLKKVLRFKNSSQVYNYYNKITLSKERKDLQSFFQRYCSNFLSTLPYKVKLTKFSHIVEQNPIIKDILEPDFLDSLDVVYDLQETRSKIDQLLLSYQSYSHLLFNIGVELANSLFLLNFNSFDGRKNIKKLVLETQKRWNQSYKFLLEGKSYFNSFYRKQTLDQKSFFSFYVFADKNSYPEYEKYLQNYAKKREEK